MVMNNTKQIKAGEFKAKCLELMDQVAERGETWVITKRGKPVARLIPVEKPAGPGVFGNMQGTAEITGDIIASGEDG